MEKSYKFRLYPTPAQEQLIQRTFGCCRFVYNHFLAQRISLYKEGVSTSRFKQDKQLTVLKKEVEWLQDPDKCALQNTLKNLDVSYKNFFRGCKTGKHVGFPNFKNKKVSRKSYTTNSNIKMFEKAIQLPKLRKVKCKVSKQIQGRILSATVSQNPSGKYYVSITCTEVDIAPYTHTGAVVGIDLGIKDFAITSDGAVFENHKHLRKSEVKLTKLQKQLSRKSRGSNNRNKARIKVARLHEKIANQRADALHKLSTQLIKNYDIICVETLKPSNMVKNHKLAKSISDVSWSKFVRQLEYKAVWHNRLIVKVDRFYPSSQTCHVCGAKNAATKDLSVRSWICPDCGAIHDRDKNAAINILNEGLRLIA